MEGEETFDSSFLGHADEVVEERIADDDVILVKGTKNTSAVCTFQFQCKSYILYNKTSKSLGESRLHFFYAGLNYT
jgi:hypothetical protein